MQRHFSSISSSLFLFSYRFYSHSIELSEFNNAQQKFIEGNIGGALSELDKIKSIITHIPSETEKINILSRSLKQKYWYLQYSKSYYNKIENVLQSINDLPENNVNLAWKQLLHDHYLLSKKNNEAEEIYNLFKQGNTQDHKFRYYIAQSRRNRLLNKNEEILSNEYLDSLEDSLKVEGLCELGDSLIHSNPNKSYEIYNKAYNIYNIDENKPNINTLQVLGIRKARSFLLGNKNNREQLDNEEINNDIKNILSKARIEKTKYWGEITGILAMIYQCKSNFTLAEGLYRKSLEIFDDIDIKPLPIAPNHIIQAEIKQSYSLLAKIIHQDTLSKKLDTETDLLSFRFTPTFSQYLPYSFLPINIEEELETEKFLP